MPIDFVDEGGYETRQESSKRASTPGNPLPMLGSVREQTLLALLVLVAMTFGLYSTSLHNQFVNYDDPSYVLENPHVNSGLSIQNIRWAVTGTASDNWHPLTWISHMTDVTLFGLKPAGHHLDSVVWHLLNVILVFLLLRAATGYFLRSFVVAALFAVCPLNVESVAWVAERKTLICTTFLLLALFAYGWYARRPSAGKYFVLLGLFALGLMSKPMVITLPFALLLLDYWPLNRIKFQDSGSKSGQSSGIGLGKLIVEKIPLLLLSAASAAITISVQRAGGATRGFGAPIPMAERLANAAVSYALYLWKAVWPTRLAVFYPHPEGSLPIWEVVTSAALILAISVGVWRYRERRYLVTGWLWFLGTLVPVLGIVQVGRQAMADRYAYIPFLGLFVMLVWLAAEVAAKLPSARWIIAAAATIAIVGYACVTFIQIGYWRTSEALFTHAIDVTEHNGVAEENLGVAYLQVQRPDLAFDHLKAAVEYMPDFSTAHYDYGTLLQQAGRMDKALNEYSLALQFTGDTEEAARIHNNVGSIMLQRNSLDDALREYNTALQLDPIQPSSLLGRGTVEFRQSHLELAEQDLTRLVQVHPSPIAWYSLGRTLEVEGKLQPAANAYQIALNLAPSFDAAQQRLDALRLAQPK
jgi:protein O-mannosyl-transferase